MAGHVRGSQRTAKIVGILAVVLGLALLTAPAATAGTQGAARHREPGLRERLPGPAASAAGLLPDRPALSGAGRARPTAGAPASAAGSWQVQPARSAITTNGFLYAVSCPAASACVSVGSYENDSGTEVSLAQASAGTAWHTVATPNPPGAEYTKLYGVSCLAADACTAAGYYLDGSGNGHPLAEQWNGTSWKIRATPGVTGSNNSGLFAISCAAADACLAVGATRNIAGTTAPLAEAWNGTAWRVLTVPIPSGSTFNEFRSVSCSAATACTAGGVTGAGVSPDAPLAERWNGTSWQIQATPAISGSFGAEFQGMSCPAAQSCVAVGNSGTAGGNEATLAESWNGTSWTVQPTQVPEHAVYNELLAVSCTAPDACTAVGWAGFLNGQSRALANRWDGTSWQLQTTPVPPPHTPLAEYAAVSCTGAAACTAAGAAWTRSNLTTGLVAAWQGTSWQTQATPDPAGAAVQTILGGVSCPSASDCVAVGYFYTNAVVAVPLAESWDGTSWQIQATPLPAGSGSLSTVSCTSASACTAVGSYLDSSTGQTVTLAERWDGTSWQVQSTPNPAAAMDGSSLGSVSCSAPDACMAVGNYNNGAASVPFAETWDGTSWTVQTVPYPPKGGYVSGVSCTSPSDCVAIGRGSYMWNGTAWRYQRATRPAHSRTVRLYSVSCSSASWCTAVGSYGVPGVRGSQTLAEDWNGTRWALQTTPNKAKAKYNTLYGVSCTSASACTAIGVYQHGGLPPQFADAEAWNGTSWTLETLPTPPRAEATVLFGVSCLASGCTATGASIAQISGIQLALALHTSA
jgi:hypothetical protein